MRRLNWLNDDIWVIECLLSQFDRDKVLRTGSILKLERLHQRREWHPNEMKRQTVAHYYATGGDHKPTGSRQYGRRDQRVQMWSSGLISRAFADNLVDLACAFNRDKMNASGKAS